MLFGTYIVIDQLIIGWINNFVNTQGQCYVKIKIITLSQTIIIRTQNNVGTHELHYSVTNILMIDREKLKTFLKTTKKCTENVIFLSQLQKP